MSEPDDPRLGRVIADRYELVTRVGLGTLGLVYLARHVSLDRRVVLELLDAERVDREAVRERFKSVMKQLARVRHPNVVELESFGVDPEGSLYVVTKHVDAPRLNELIERERRLSWARGRDLALQIAAAIDAAHKRSVTHGGLRPEACHVIIKAPRSEQVVVTDFALGEIAVETRFASDVKGATTRLAGDPRYLALEQFTTGHGSVVADVYAIGAVLYHVLTGEPPHSGANAFHALHQRRGRPLVPPREIEPSIPLEVEAVLLRALAVEPGARHPNVRELAAALEAIPADAAVLDLEVSRPASMSMPDPLHPAPPPLVLAPRVVEESVVLPTHLMPIWRPSAPVEDEATTMMPRRVPLGPGPVEATTRLGPAATAFGAKPEETTVLSSGVATRDDSSPAPACVRAPPLPPTERLSAALEPPPLTTALLPPPTTLIASPSFGSSPSAPSLPQVLRVPAPPSQTTPRAPASPLPMPPAAEMLSPPTLATTWLWLLGAAVVVAVVGALIGLVIAKASIVDRASQPESSSPEVNPKPRRRE